MTSPLSDNVVDSNQVESTGQTDARTFQLAVMSKGDQVSQRFIHLYATLITLLTFGFLFWAAFGHDYEANPGSENIVNIIIGFLLGTALAAVVQFFFGSSMGSKTKGDQLSLLKGDKE